MSESGKWRCPYCDGLNDWQNEACEICGDGKRPDIYLACGQRAGHGLELAGSVLKKHRDLLDTHRVTSILKSCGCR